MGMRRAVFLDRDGVINELLHNHENPEDSSNYVTSWEQFRFIPGSVDAIRELVDCGYMVIVVSNQSGIGRGYCESDAVVDIMLKMCDAVGRGDMFDFYFCPHVPDDGCSCRKPEPGMFYHAAVEHSIELRRSWMVGDRPNDIAAGILACILPTRCIMIGSSLGRQGIGIRFPTGPFVFQPRIEASLADAANYIRAIDSGLELPRYKGIAHSLGALN